MRSEGYRARDGDGGLGRTIGLSCGTTLLSSERRGGRDARDWTLSWDSKEGLMAIDIGLLLDAEDLGYDIVAAIGIRFGLVSSQATADFSELKSSSDVEDWGEFSWFPPSNAKIAPVESDGLWRPLDACLLALATEPVGVAFRVLVFRRRNTHRTIAAIRRRTANPPTTPPAIAPLFTDESSSTGVGDVRAGSPGADGEVLGDRERVEVGVTDRLDDGGANKHDTSGPLVIVKILDGTASANESTTR